MISAIFIRRPRFAIVIALVTVLAGLLALTRIPIAQLPDIVPPEVNVSAAYPGASAAVLEATVAQPLEAAILGVDKMMYMTSSSAADGTYSLSVSFELGTDPDINTVNVNNRVQTAMALLPQEVQLQGLTVRKRSASVLQFIVLYSEGAKLDSLFITNYGIINVLDELARTPGVGLASLFGRLDYSMRIWFDTARLTSLGLAPSDVIAAVQSQNVQAPVGRIGAQPVPADQQFQLNLQTQGRLTTPEEFGEIVIRANSDGSVLQLRDVARVELRRPEPGRRESAQRRAGRDDRHLSGARGQCHPNVGGGQRRHSTRSARAFPQGWRRAPSSTSRYSSTRPFPR